jgi:hypothetical protein
MRPSTAFTEENGSMVPLFGGLVVVAFVMIALVVEIALLGATYRSVSSTADAAAEAGAAMLSEGDLYRSVVEIDRSRSVAEASRVIRALAGPTASFDLDVHPTTICVRVHQAYEPATLAFLGLGQVEVSVTSCAEPRVG